MEIPLRTKTFESGKGVQQTANYAESKVKPAKTTLTELWNSPVEYDDQEEKGITREKANIFVASRWPSLADQQMPVASTASQSNSGRPEIECLRRFRSIPHFIDHGGLENTVAVAMGGDEEAAGRRRASVIDTPLQKTLFVVCQYFSRVASRSINARP
jgi:hypothetical protein